MARVRILQAVPGLFLACGLAAQQPPPSDTPLDQVPSFWQRIESAEASGDDEVVWDLEQELLRLVRQHLDALEAVPVLHEMADRQMQHLGRVVDGIEAPQRQVSHYCSEIFEGDEGGCYSGNRKNILQAMLAEASRNYADAIVILLRAESYSSDELRALEMGLVRGAELIRDEYAPDREYRFDEQYVMLMPTSSSGVFAEPWRSRVEPIMALADWDLPYDSAGTPEEDFLKERGLRADRFTSVYSRGRQSLRRLYAYEVTVSHSAFARASALVQIADWDLLLSRNGLAIEGYVLALRMIEEGGADEASIAELFAPATPIVLPAFEPSPFVLDPTRAAAGHIDASFALTEFGRARDIEIRDTANATDADRAEVLSRLKSSRFRPRPTDGEFDDSSPIAVRYYLYD